MTFGYNNGVLGTKTMYPKSQGTRSRLSKNKASKASWIDKTINICMEIRQDFQCNVIDTLNQG